MDDAVASDLRLVLPGRRRLSVGRAVVAVGARLNDDASWIADCRRHAVPPASL